MQTKDMKRRIEILEGELTSGQIAKLWLRVLDKAWNKETSPGELEKEFEAWSARYMLPRAKSERLKTLLEVDHLEIRRLIYEYAIKCIEKEELAILYISALVVCFRGARIMEDMKKDLINDIPKQYREKHFMEFPEDRELIEGKEVRSSCEDIEDLLITLQKELCDDYKEAMNNTELWDLLGYPRPKSVLLENFEEINAAINRLPASSNSKREDEHNE